MPYLKQKNPFTEQRKAHQLVQGEGSIQLNVVRSQKVGDSRQGHGFIIDGQMDQAPVIKTIKGWNPRSAGRPAPYRT